MGEHIMQTVDELVKSLVAKIQKKGYAKHDAVWLCGEGLNTILDKIKDKVRPTKEMREKNNE